MFESTWVWETWIMFNCDFNVIILKWGREAIGSGSDLLPWRSRYPLPPPMHCLETYNVPSPRTRVSVLIQCMFSIIWQRGKNCWWNCSNKLSSLYGFIPFATVLIWCKASGDDVRARTPWFGCEMFQFQFTDFEINRTNFSEPDTYKTSYNIQNSLRVLSPKYFNFCKPIQLFNLNYISRLFVPLSKRTASRLQKSVT
jgi:hypothetical protein